MFIFGCFEDEGGLQSVKYPGKLDIVRAVEKFRLSKALFKFSSGALWPSLHAHIGKLTRSVSSLSYVNDMLSLF